jgi:adenylate cyclase
MPRVLTGLYKRFGLAYLWLIVVAEVVSACVICAATVGLFSLYTEVSDAELWRITAFAEALTLICVTFIWIRTVRAARPLIRWLAGSRSEKGALDAWRTAISLPREFVLREWWAPPLMVLLPISVYFTAELDLPLYSVAIIFAGGLVALGYSAVLEFFASESFLRPVVEDIASRLPKELAGKPEGVPLRWKLLAALPVINIVTGVVVSGLSSDGTTSLGDLGVDVVVALVVAFTVSFGLTLLVTKSVLRPVDDLLGATRRVRTGDLQTRVPLTSGDELGSLAVSFNEMMEGLSEREALRRAFGSYVDPEVAERVLEEGEMLEGRDVEATVAFIDVRDFTAFADRASAEETVGFLNEFFDLVVPILLRHRGHANKFLGDGLMAVFGAPDRLPDHADRALAAACEIASSVERHFGGDVHIGIGLNSGPVVAGSMGGGGRLEFTVIGDPVNVASRVEAESRKTGDVVLLTEATRCLLGRGDDYRLDPRGEVPLRGKSQPVPVYAATVLDERMREGEAELTAET